MQLFMLSTTYELAVYAVDHVIDVGSIPAHQKKARNNGQAAQKNPTRCGSRRLI
jgi:hypothetical protein